MISKRKQEYSRLYWIKNKQRLSEKNKEYRHLNKEKVQDGQRRWAKANPDKRKIHKQKWNSLNKNKTKFYSANRRARVLESNLGGKFKKEVRQFYLDCPEGMEVDHIIPLDGKEVKGLHVPWNLQYLDPVSNKKKGNKYGTDIKINS